MTQNSPDEPGLAPGATPANASDSERIIALLDAISAYMEQYHNGWVKFEDYSNGVLKVRLGGACVGCALSTTTLHGWVEGTLRPFFPDLQRVEAVT
ncbi:MAG: NifU family protein [Anaerolineales bacterium]